MHHFLSVCRLSGLDQKSVLNGVFAGSCLRLCMWHVHITRWAQCQRQVAFLPFVFVFLSRLQIHLYWFLSKIFIKLSKTCWPETANGGILPNPQVSYKNASRGAKISYLILLKLLYIDFSELAPRLPPSCRSQKPPPKTPLALHGNFGTVAPPQIFSLLLPHQYGHVPFLLGFPLRLLTIMTNNPIHIYQNAGNETKSVIMGCFAVLICWSLIHPET